MKHRGGWRLDQHHPGTFRWRSPLNQTYWTRGDPIAPDLPEPLPRPDSADLDGDDPDGDDLGGDDRDPVGGGRVLPIFAPRTPPAPRPQPALPEEDIDDDPPF